MKWSVEFSFSRTLTRIKFDIKASLSFVRVNKGPAHYVRIYGIFIYHILTEYKLINSSQCVKRSDASIQGNRSVFLRSVGLHHWGNKLSKCHTSQTKSKTGNFIAPKTKKRKIPSTIFIHHRHSEGRTIEKIHLIIHICIMFYIGPSVVTSELLLFFLFFLYFKP